MTDQSLSTNPFSPQYSPKIDSRGQKPFSQPTFFSSPPDETSPESALRKGKWTVEEERYANKVIEYFNGGTLKLDEQDRGITLRAYLSQKLGCDPMRITKKYTGAMCLGKRVYHQYRQHGRPELVEQHNAELQVLEDEFRAKLAQISARRKGSSSNNEKFIAGSPAVTTPGIEALLKSHPYHPDAAWPPQPAQVFISPYTPDYLNSLLPSQTTLGAQPAAKQGSSNQPGNGSSGHIVSHLMPTTNLVPAYGRGAGNIVAQGDGAPKRPRVEGHEPHDTEAASSLLGFFTHLERNSSQEDMVHFFEGVQKNVAATVGSGSGSGSGGFSPSKPPPATRTDHTTGRRLNGSPSGAGAGASAGTGGQGGGAMSASLPVEGRLAGSVSSRSLP